MGFFDKFKKQTTDERVAAAMAEPGLKDVPKVEVEEMKPQVNPLGGTRVNYISFSLDEISKIKMFVDLHRQSCGINSYDSIFRHYDGKKDKVFLKCPKCNRGIEVETDQDPVAFEI